MAKNFETLILFGATGDLAHRMLFPSLYNLDKDGLLGDGFTILGSGRTELDDDAFRASIDEQLKTFLPEDQYDAASAQHFLARVDYVALDMGGDKGFAALKAKLGARADKPLGIYLSTPPSLFGPIIDGLNAAGLACGECRVALEKPIGQDLASSREVNDTVGAAFDEDRVFRVDHYLGKETVQNLLALRFANILFEPLWNANAIDHVQISVAETVGLEGRVSYYDGVGALKDMVQNHLLQLVAMVAMEPPANYSATAVRDEKVKVLRCLRKVTPETVKGLTVKGQYGAGAVGGEAVKGYDEELGKDSNTETFVSVKAFIDNWRWAGVPFYIRTGKRMPQRKSEILIQFKRVPHDLFASRGAGLEPNALIIRLQPEETIRLQVMAKRPGLDRDGVELQEVELDVSLDAAYGKQRRRIAYERLLLDFIEGDQTLFVRRDEVEAAWEWIDSIHNAWDRTGFKPQTYVAGSWGPSSSVALTERDGASWHD